MKEIRYQPTSLSSDDLERLGYYNLSVKNYSFLESFGAGGVSLLESLK